MPDLSHMTLEDYARMIGGAVMQRVVLDDAANTNVGYPTLEALRKPVLADPTSDDPKVQQRSADPGAVRERLDQWVELLTKRCAGLSVPKSTPTALGVRAMVTGASGGGDRWIPGPSAKRLYQAMGASIQAGTNPAFDAEVAERFAALFRTLIMDAQRRSRGA